MSFDLLGFTIGIDASNSWAGLINHQWDFPYDKEKKEGEKDWMELEKDWEEYFSNATVDKHGDIITLKNIPVGEEISIDYGTGYWEEPPDWNAGGGPEDLREALRNPDNKKLFALAEKSSIEGLEEEEEEEDLEEEEEEEDLEVVRKEQKRRKVGRRKIRLNDDSKHF